MLGISRCILAKRTATPPTPILSAVGYNFRRILAWLSALLRYFLITILRLLISQSALNPAC
jgi:IS5 family transposase